MADNFNPADNLSEQARSKGGKNSHRSSNTNANDAAGKTEAAKKGGKNSHDNQYTS